MDPTWRAATPLARQAAAAEMWMEMTGRTKLAQAEVFREGQQALEKRASTPGRLTGAAGGALAGTMMGAYRSYKDHRVGADGTSKAELRNQQELEQLERLFSHQGKDLKNLPGMSKMKHEYARRKLEATLQAKGSLRHAAVEIAPWAIVGAGLGAHMGPKASEIARRLRA
jgi:hypothetical protein